MPSWTVKQFNNFDITELYPLKNVTWENANIEQNEVENDFWNVAQFYHGFLHIWENSAFF